MNKCPKCGSTNIGHQSHFHMDYCKDCGLDEEDAKELKRIMNTRKNVGMPLGVQRYLESLDTE